MRYFSLLILLCAYFHGSGQEVRKTKVLIDTVSFKGPTGISFNGVFSRPKGSKAFSTVIIVSGTGKQDLNGTMAGHKIFLELANYLNSRGIAVLRTDDRGTGKTTGVYETSTTADFADDVISAVNYLKTRKDLDHSKVGLIGHSEGGAVSAIAAGKSDDIHFLVSMAGLAMSGYEALIQQNRDLVDASPMDQRDKKRSNEINELMFKVAHTYANSDSMAVMLNQTYQNWKIQDDAYMKTINIKYDHFRFPINSYIRTATGPWYRYFIQYDAEKTISALHIPILAINGDKDLMVAADANLENWKNYASAGGNSMVTVKKLTNINHLFLPCQTCTSAETPKIKDGVSPIALELVSNWILDVNKKRK